MAEEFKGLENKLEGVSIGDLLLLRQEGGDIVGGFVEQLTPKKVILSTESPTNSTANARRYFPIASRGNNEYYLRNYNQYVLMDPDFTSE